MVIWLSGKHICTSPLTENTLQVHVLAHLQLLFVSLLFCISATKTQWNRTSEFLGMCHGHWRPPVLCMAGYPAENGKCCKMYVQEKDNTVIISKVLSEEEGLVSLNPMFCFKWQEVTVNVGLWARYVGSFLESWDQCKIQRNFQPTPPLTQHFALSEKLVLMLT